MTEFWSDAFEREILSVCGLATVGGLLWGIMGGASAFVVVLSGLIAFAVAGIVYVPPRTVVRESRFEQQGLIAPGARGRWSRKFLAELVTVWLAGIIVAGALAFVVATELPMLVVGLATFGYVPIRVAYQALRSLPDSQGASDSTTTDELPTMELSRMDE